MYFMWFAQLTVIISLNNINRLICAVEAEFVFCEDTEYNLGEFQFSVLVNINQNVPQISRGRFILRPAAWRRTLTKSSDSVNHTYCQGIM